MYEKSRGIKLANQEHLNILKKGVDEWNQWRDKNPGIEPNLVDADLAGLRSARLSSIDPDKACLWGADLSDAHLREVYLGNARFYKHPGLDTINFSGVNLTGANLVEAFLSAADLRWACLNDADLRRTSLNEADLSAADLRKACLGNAHLRRANLTEANLGGIDLNAATLVGANLVGVYLQEADLRWANLSRANLHATNLLGADLSNADLGGADLHEAKVGWTRFGNVDLSKAKNLDTLKHIGPSTIGVDTIYRSKGNIPETFLKGVGVQEEFIVHMSSFVGMPRRFYSCFLCYSSKDQAFAERLFTDLQSKGVRCWYAPEDLSIGEKIRIGIDESIRLHDKLLVVLSQNSVQSEWVEQEVETALRKERHENRTALFPIRLDNAVME